MNEPYFRWMIRRDRPKVLKTETLCFEFPWPEDHIAWHLQQRSIIGGVIELPDGQIVGHCFYQLQQDNLELLRIAVRPEYQRCGYGKFVIDRLRMKLSSQRRKTVTAITSEWNVPAQLFFRGCGMKYVAVDHKLFGDDHDAYTFEVGPADDHDQYNLAAHQSGVARTQ